MYSKQELVAEIGSALLCADLGITPKSVMTMRPISGIRKQAATEPS